MLDLIIESVSDLTDRIREFRLVSADGTSLPGWTAGAHLEFDLGEAGSRSYSLIDWIAGTSEPDAYTIAVQREDDGDGGSRAMHALGAGDSVPAGDPKNDFPLTGTDATIYLLAGGIGITPIISMAACLSAGKRMFQLHYACRSAAVAAYVPELQTAFGDALHLHADDTAPIDLRKLATSAANDNAHLYICGPKPMIEAARAAAETAGIPGERIHVELFSTPEAPAGGDQSFEVEIKDTGQVFTIPPGQNIISVLNAAGVDLIYDCLRGDCGICQVDVIDGIPDHRDVVLTDAEKAKNDVIQICVSRAKSARLVLDI